MGDLKADLESAKRAREALESEVARLRDDLKHADEKQKELERCITEGQDNAAAMAFRNESLTRQLEEGRWEMGAANMEVARLRADNDTLNRQFLDAQKHSSDAAVNANRAWGLVNERDRELAFLRGYVAYLEQTSAGSREASQAAFSNMEAFYRNRLSFMGSKNQELQANLGKLYQFFRKANLEEVSKSNEATAQLTKARADVIAVQQHLFTLRQRLAFKNEELKAAKSTSEKLASSRDELREMMAAMQEKDEETARNKEKNRAKAKKERSAAQERTKVELERLESKIQEQEEDVRERQATQEKLEGELNAEMARQEELKTALKVAESEAARYKDIAEGLQRQKELWMKMDENDALWKANAKLNGYSFGSAHIILEQLGRNKGFLFVRILEGVHERLQKAMEAGSTREANDAVDNITIFLEAAVDRINDYVSLVIHDMTAIMAMITDINKFMPIKIDNRRDITQMHRMCQGVRALKDDVVPLLEDGKKIIERRGWAGAVVGGPMLESSKPRPLLTDGSSLETFTTVQSVLEAPPQATRQLVDRLVQPGGGRLVLNPTTQLGMIGDFITTLFGSKKS
ncbi:uncharacterized protein K444DRAFT_399607 [Hyaloscypha bicolor E]|uniref:Uncharacterized protein n=1 Tax=Hyaloscypha bicolor E TaxID=1095630 RepID=A0A2J6TB33_9HELO|nr:uncharacterized protein K444DRAFT_399607 [Hyaloscypha bicolor E]PMD60244.1 hypothetical protein K444DRAFT_399607 [Hyaloscypha bicolor E]